MKIVIIPSLPTASQSDFHASQYGVFIHFGPNTLDASANLLLNVGPDENGLIPEYHAKFLIEAIADFS